MASKSSKMYKDSPKTERNKDGKVAVVKKDTAPKETEAATEGNKTNDGGEPDAQIKTDGKGLPVSFRHAAERRDMVNRHETEHALADAAMSDKAEVHGRHVVDMKALHKKHEKELKTKG